MSNRIATEQTHESMVQKYGFLKLEEVLEIVGVSTATWYRMIKKNLAPKPVQISSGRSGWARSEIAAFCEQRMAARSANDSGDEDTPNN